VKRSNDELKQLLELDAKRTYSRTALLGILAAREAASDAGIAVDRLRIGLISSTSVGGMDRSEEFYKTFKTDHSRGRLRNVIAHDCGASTE
ncbi:hypothetical protein KB213_12020, partial [Neokomagataea sp. TBRC 2177]